MESANWYNERGVALEEEGKTGEAEAAYQQAIDAEPRWSVPWYNLGLLHKRQLNWDDSLRCNQRAVEIDPDDVASWWNLGVAATALEDWREARQVWRGVGIELPPGEGPVAMELGLTPIRINARHNAEVLWCWRVDPARAIIRSVPLPESRHRFGDVILHDGAPNGYRTLGDREVSVFDELEVLEPSSFSTYEVLVNADSTEEIEALLELATEYDMGAEDWSTSIQMLCKLCSEGRPHEQHQWEERTKETSERRLGIAADAEEELQTLLARWTAKRPGREIQSLRCVLEA